MVEEQKTKVNILIDGNPFKMIVIKASDTLDSIRTRYNLAQENLFLKLDDTCVALSDEKQIATQNIVIDENGKNVIKLKSTSPNQIEIELVVNDIPQGRHKIAKNSNLSEARSKLNLQQSAIFMGGEDFEVDKNDESDFLIEEILVEGTLQIKDKTSSQITALPKNGKQQNEEMKSDQTNRPNQKMNEKKDIEQPVKKDEKMEIEVKQPKKLVDYEVFQNMAGIEIRYIKSKPISDKIMKKAKRMFIVGETGAGKTTLINSLLNYYMGVQLKDKFRYKLILESEKKSQVHSQTVNVTEYIVYNPNRDYPLIFVDTPGLGDTQGIEQDRKNRDKIAQCLKQISHLTTIAFVCKSNMNRLTDTSKFIANTILSLFGENSQKNFTLLCTFADNKKPQALEAAKEAAIPVDRFFKFNCSAVFPDVGEDLNKGQYEYDQEDEFTKIYWNMNEYSIKIFFDALEKFNDLNLDQTSEVIRKREDLENRIFNLNNQVEKLVQELANLNNYINDIKIQKMQIEKTRDYQIKCKRMKRIEVKTENFTTFCIHCKTTCHDNCAYKNDADKQHCIAMDGQNCKICEDKCHWTVHQNVDFVVQLEEEEYTQNIDEKLKLYTQATNKAQQIELYIQDLNRKVHEYEEEIIINLTKIKSLIFELSKIALIKSHMSVLDHLKRMKENEEYYKKQGWEGRLVAIKQSIEFYNTLELIDKTDQQEYLNKLLEQKKFDKQQILAYIKQVQPQVQQQGFFKRAYNEVKSWF